MYLPLTICAFCFHDIDLRHIVSCENNRYVHFKDGSNIPSIPFYPRDILFTKRCPDCNVRIGGYHHPGCEYEVCPKCSGYIVECGCLNKKDTE